MSGAASALVTTAWLAASLGRRNVRVVDGSWHMPHLGRNARAEFAEAHIPGAVFFDIDAIADTRTSLPHMLPSAAAFVRHMSGFGIGDRDRVIVYDSRGVVSAARVWWTFRAFGHDAVAVLDGGFARWRAEGRPTEAGTPAPKPRHFKARLRRSLVRDLASMRRNVKSRKEQVLDARSAGRFAGTEPEPRAGLRGGHIPGSLNLPYDILYRPDTTLLPPDGLRQAFAAAGVDLGKPVVTTCGSGITASVLALGLHLVGHKKVAVYDGSWTEWAGREDTPVLEGDAHELDHVGVDRRGAGGGARRGGLELRVRRLGLLPARERQEIEQHEVAHDQEQGLVHGARSSGRRGFLDLQDELALAGADVADLHEGHADDAEKVGGVGGKQVGVDDANHLEHERRGGAGDADVEAAVKEVLLVLHEPELCGGRDRGAGDLGDLQEADHIHAQLQGGERRDGEEGGYIHGSGCG